jgi:hypothetical protein
VYYNNCNKKSSQPIQGQQCSDLTTWDIVKAYILSKPMKTFEHLIEPTILIIKFKSTSLLQAWPLRELDTSGCQKTN